MHYVNYPIHCHKCSAGGKMPFQYGRDEYYCPTCKNNNFHLEPPGEAKCLVNPTHQLKHTIRCLSRGEEACGSTYAVDPDSIVRITDPVKGTCSKCFRTEVDVIRELRPFGGDTAAMDVNEQSLRNAPDITTREELEAVIERVKEYNRRLYCRECFQHQLRYKRGICAKCFSDRGFVEVLKLEYYCLDCKSDLCEVTQEPEGHCSIQCVHDSRHANIALSHKCMRCQTHSIEHPKNFLVLQKGFGDCASRGAQCIGDRVFQCGCALKHSYCVNCISAMIDKKSPTLRIVCRVCNTSVGIGETDAARDQQLVNDLTKKLEDGIVVRCTCPWAQINPPPREAVELSNTSPIITCPACKEQYCAVCSKRGGCHHSTVTYSLPEELRKTMIEWQATRVVHVIGILRAFAIVDRFVKSLDPTQRSALQRTACPLGPVLDRYLRILITDCSRVTFRFGRGWSAINDDANQQRISALMQKLNIDTNDRIVP